MDPNSLSNLHEIVTRHISLSLNADFSRKVLHGFVRLTGEALVDGIQKYIVDTRDLTLEKVEENGVQLKYDLEKEHPVFGKALNVHLARALSKGDKVTITIYYETSPEASSIQWLEPSQTAGKKQPYLFTQCQAIHARSMLPCQDAPSVKATYDASITVPKDLTAVMSAVSQPKGAASDGKNTFSFKQDVPMSSYLIALGIGEIESREIGPRSRVWSEKSMVEAGAYEFAETEEFLKIGEDLLGPYVWGRYDILLLPPSFPYGGMENPCLTFVTPTLLAGDRSNADVVAHEIAHSWTGNLVTNKTWEHFWLNEGMTVWTERKIVGVMRGEPMRHFSAIIGEQALKESIKQFGETNPLTNLIPNLKDIDPDDAFSSVPYEKGFNFLFYLETLVGEPSVFAGFMKSYIQHYKYQSVTSEDFKRYFLDYFKNADQSKLATIDWEKWFNTPGMPIVQNQFDQTVAKQSEELAQKWIAGGQGTSAEDIKNWRAGQTVVFLDRLDAAAPLPKETLQKLDSTYNFTGSKNAEIRFRWYKLGAQSEYEAILPQALSFLKEQGRMKFVRPLYRALFKSKFGKDAVVQTFKENRNIYHGIAQKMVAKDLEL
eukprot:TRINITY_DN4794_c0_g1_i1.p1 TRINITY_DN4794_c0_g1~~TRINITY_DN4794_c0_g1_i1.p1  ORF type:complete len:601 (+),score=152.57 TRINITY_DN4794_c0_g1_i1:41-1843(+)